MKRYSWAVFSKERIELDNYQNCDKINNKISVRHLKEKNGDAP